MKTKNKFISLFIQRYKLIVGMTLLFRVSVLHNMRELFVIEVAVFVNFTVAKEAIDLEKILNLRSMLISNQPVLECTDRPGV